MVSEYLLADVLERIYQNLLALKASGKGSLTPMGEHRLHQSRPSSTEGGRALGYNTQTLLCI